MRFPRLSRFSPALAARAASVPPVAVDPASEVPASSPASEAAADTPAAAAPASPRKVTREQLRAAHREAERESRACYVADRSAMQGGSAVRMPSGAIYADVNGELRRVDKVRATKKERRAARAAAKARKAKSVEQIQAEVAAAAAGGEA